MLARGVPRLRLGAPLACIQSDLLAVDTHAQPSLKDEDNSVPTPQDKSTVHDVKVNEVLPETKQKGLNVVIDHHNFPKAHKPNAEGSSKSTADNPEAAVPASPGKCPSRRHTTRQHSRRVQTQENQRLHSRS